MKNYRIPEQPNYDINLTNIYSRFGIKYNFFSYKKHERYKSIIC